MAAARTAALMVLLVAPPAASVELQVTAPPALAGVAARVRALDQPALAAALAEAGLQAPPRVHVVLIPEDDPRARASPRWVVGVAVGEETVAIFPARVGSYPYDSLDAVLRHEVAHLALSARAGGRPLPRWFHEGVAVVVESGWGPGSDLRLLLGAASDPALADLTKLFSSDSHLGSSGAYLLAAALVADIRERHGARVPGAIAERVANGIPFGRAFQLETGESPEAAAAQAWAAYRRWTTWLPAVTSSSAIWTFILALATVAFAIRLRRRARRRRQWDEEDGWPTG
jgi:hypothetical protein